MDKVAKVGEDRVRLRQEQSAPVLAKLHEKFLDWKEQLLLKHLVAEASPILRSGQPGPCRAFENRAPAARSLARCPSIGGYERNCG